MLWTLYIILWLFVCKWTIFLLHSSWTALYTTWWRSYQLRGETLSPLNQPVFSNTIIPKIINDAKSISTRLCKPLRQHDNATLWPFWANKVLILSEIIGTQNCPLRCQNLHSPLTQRSDKTCHYCPFDKRLNE